MAKPYRAKRFCGKINYPEYVDNTNEIVDEMSDGSGRRIYAKQKLRRSPTGDKLPQH